MESAENKNIVLVLQKHRFHLTRTMLLARKNMAFALPKP